MDIQNLVRLQRDFFNQNKTLDMAFRLEALDKLYAKIKEKENEILRALKEDLNKSATEAYMSEVGMVLGEISYFKRNLRKWNKPKRVLTSLANFPSRSKIYPQPYGRVLIMAPWNYPFYLSIMPLIGAIGGGNCAVVKPSAYAPTTALIIKDILDSIFPKDFVFTVLGEREENQMLLNTEFDYIFFTGSIKVGKLVMESASKNLTPVTLELGGKSPAIIDDTADLEKTAKSIAFGKFLNAGQTCVAPDYVLVHEKVKKDFIEKLKSKIKDFYTKDPLNFTDYPKIINKGHFERLESLINEEKIVFGGKVDKTSLKIEPTIIDEPDNSSPLMEEEIFGPILPIVSFTSINEVIQELKKKEKPLALYIFTKNKNLYNQVIKEIPFGGGCVNDTIVHLASPSLPFGGLGQSGMGAYHGKYSFETFTHKKSIVKKGSFDLPLKYPPYSSKRLSLLKKVLK